MRLIIAEDDVLLREGIARILGDEGYEIVAQAGDPDDLLGEGPDAPSGLSSSPTSGCLRRSPDDGIAAALQIRRELPDIAIIVLSQHIDTPGALELLTLGADRIGYLLKSRVMDLDEFLDSVHRVVAGGSSIDPEVISSLVRREVRDHQDHGVGLLTPRRLEVLQLMAQGFSNAQHRPRAGRHREGRRPQHRSHLPDPRAAPVGGRASSGARGDALPQPLIHAGGAGPTAVSDDTVDRRRSPGPLIG